MNIATLELKYAALVSSYNLYKKTVTSDETLNISKQLSELDKAIDVLDNKMKELDILNEQTFLSSIKVPWHTLQEKARQLLPVVSAAYKKEKNGLSKAAALATKSLIANLGMFVLKEELSKSQEKVEEPQKTTVTNIAPSQVGSGVTVKDVTYAYSSLDRELQISEPAQQGGLHPSVKKLVTDFFNLPPRKKTWSPSPLFGPGSTVTNVTIIQKDVATRVNLGK